MITYKTLEVYFKKCEDAKDQVEKELLSAKEHLRHMEDQKVAITAQMDTIKQLMDAENPPVIEIPAGGDKIEELFDERLGKAGLPGEEELRKMRQEGVYKSEALGIVDQIDDINKEDNNGESAEIHTA